MEYNAIADGSDLPPAKPANQPADSWRVLASVAAASLLGAPFLASGTFHAAWAQIVHLAAACRSWYIGSSAH